jgi:predicted ATPase
MYAIIAYSKTGSEAITIMLRFSHIRLENWRNFSEIDIPLQNRAFLVGPNASGKSNFLDAFRFLRDVVVPGGGFQDSITRRGGVKSIRSLSARSRSDIVVDVSLAEEGHEAWRYRLAFNQEHYQRPPILVEETVWHRGKKIIGRPDNDDRADPARRQQTLLEQTFANQDFRTIAETFREIQYLHLVPQLIRDPERYIGGSNDEYGGDFLEQIAMETKRTQTARLNKILSILRVAVPQFQKMEFERDGQGKPHLRVNYDHWRDNGAWQQETDLSDGTLRLIGLLWALQAGDGLLLFEEPELSLHPAIVRHLPQMMLQIHRERKEAFRQTFLSTHSPEILSDEGISPEEVLLFMPAAEGSEIRVAAEDMEVMSLYKAELPMSEALSRIEPYNLHQLAAK